MEFDELFDVSPLPCILKKARTLVKEECREIYSYMSSLRPKTILEFGVQYGCSSRVFLEIGKWIGSEVVLHSWDIVDAVRKDCISKDDFYFHIENISGKEKGLFDKYAPDLLFLDAHPYRMTKSLIQECLSRKIDFMTHDVEYFVFDRAKKQSKNFTDFGVYVDWELYILGELISTDLYIKDYYENELLIAKCFRGHGGGGLSIIRFKRGDEDVK